MAEYQARSVDIDGCVYREGLSAVGIDGGIAGNVIPDECTFTLDIRSTPVYTHDELVKHFRKTLESRVDIHSDRIVPVATEPDAPIVRACLDANPERAEE